VSAWTRFWFAPADTHGLCLLRLFLGGVLLMRQTRMYGLHRIDRFTAYIPRYEHSESSIYDLDFTMPWPGLGWVPSPNLWIYNRLDELLLFLALLMTVGLFTRFVVPLVAAIFIWILAASQVNYYHHFWLFTLLFTILAFSHCGERYSLDAYLRGPDAPRPKRPILPVRLIQVLVSLLYLFTFLAKMNSGWYSGEIMRIFDESGSIRGPFAPLFLNTLGYQGLSVSTLAAEGFLVFGFWIPRLRMVAIAVGVLLHLGIDAMMAVRTFSFQMWVVYIVFTHPSAGATIVLYDGRCGLCRRSRRIANLLDWLRRFSWLDFREPEVGALVPTAEREELERHMLVVTPDGRVHRGFDGWRRMMARCPATFLFSGLLWLPGVAQLGRVIYRRIADHRFRLSRAGASCRISEETGSGLDDGGWRETLARFQARSDRGV
jgi:predicted DCC family thiol-disulfide oxidoreductase YuxK